MSIPAESSGLLTHQGPDASSRRIESFHRILLFVCLFYLVVEVAYVLRLPLMTDEFQGAYSAYQLAKGLPYRDFQPYKTVLGYYLQLPLLMIARSTWTGLMLVKLEAVLATTAMLYFGVRGLRRHFDDRALLLALGLFVVHSTFLERSGELRVDMLTSICGFLGLVLLIDERWTAAGAMTILAFFVSQKGAYYVVAGEAGLLVWAATGGRLREGVRAILKFSLASAAVSFVYLACASLISSPSVVFNTVFRSAATVAEKTYIWPGYWGPRSLRAQYWPQTIDRNPAFWALAAVGLVILLLRIRRLGRRDAILLGYGAVIAAAAIEHKQPWPYFFPLVIPTLFVLVAVAFEPIEGYLALPGKNDLRRMTALLYVAVIAYSLLRLPVVLTRSNTTQKSTVDALDLLARPNDTYFAALNILYRREQPIPVLSWLDALDPYRLAMAPPQVHERFIHEFQAANLKFLVRTYQIDEMTGPLSDYFDRYFGHLWADLDVYAPRVPPGARFFVRFDGRYDLRLSPEKHQILHNATELVANSVVYLDDLPYRPGAVVYLRKGWHTLNAAPMEIRVELIPPGFEKLMGTPEPVRDSFIPIDFYTY